MADENEVTPETETPETPEVSRDDELGAIFDAANAEETAEEVSEQTSERPRGPDGKFVAKETEDTGEAAEQAPAPEITAEPGATQEPEVAPQALEAPASWSAPAKANWPSIDPVLQQELLKREADWQKADGDRANQLKGYEPIASAIEPVRQHLELNGVEPGQYVRQLVAADQYLRTEPAAAMQWIAQQYGVDLGQLTAEPEYTDPAIAPFVQEINSLKSTVQQMANQQQQGESQRLDAELQTFANAVGADGVASHPHFEEVRASMGALMQAGSAGDLQTAYDQAVWANASTREKLQAETLATARQAEVDKAAEAKRISATNLSSKGTSGGATPPQFDNREDELGSIYDNVQGAA